MIRAIFTAVCIFSLCSPVSIGQTLKLPDLLSFYKDSDLDGVIDLRDLCAGTPLDQDIDYEGCSIIHLKQFFVHFDIQFETAKHELKPEYHSELQSFAQFLSKSPDKLILVEGHTDNVGEDDFNIPLSQRRSDAIATAFTSVFGIPPDQIRSIGHGESQPITSNLTEAGRQENRRVSGEIIQLIPWPSHVLTENSLSEQPLLQDPLSHDPLTDHIEERGKVIIPFSFTESLATYQDDTKNAIQKTESQNTIEQIVNILDSLPETFVLIEGHTDNTGEPDFNNRVSKTRAQAVADAIYDKYFILRSKLKVIGHGQNRPFYSNETEEGREKNRRVEITLATRHQAEQQVYLHKWNIWNVGEELPYQEVPSQEPLYQKQSSKETDDQNEIGEKKLDNIDKASRSPAFWDIMR